MHQDCPIFKLLWKKTITLCLCRTLTELYNFLKSYQNFSKTSLKFLRILTRTHDMFRLSRFLILGSVAHSNLPYYTYCGWPLSIIALLSRAITLLSLTSFIWSSSIRAVPRVLPLVFSNVWHSQNRCTDVPLSAPHFQRDGDLILLTCAAFISDWGALEEPNKQPAMFSV